MAVNKAITSETLEEAREGRKRAYNMYGQAVQKKREAIDKSTTAEAAELFHKTGDLFKIVEMWTAHFSFCSPLLLLVLCQHRPVCNKKQLTAERYQNRTMDKGHQNALNGCLTEFCKEIEPNIILDKLLENHLFTETEVDEVKAASTNYDKNNKLMVTLKKKGPEAFLIFVDILLDPEIKKDYLVKSLNVKLEEQKLDTINIVKRQKSLKNKRSIDAEAYEFNHAKVLIITNLAYTARSGDTNYLKKTKIESKELDDMWKLKFSHEPVIAENFNQKKLRKQLVDFSNDCSKNSEIDAVFVFIISKGGEDNIRCVCEKQLKIEEVVGYFNEQNCPGMQGKPKLFFIQNSVDEKDENLADSEPIFAKLDDVFIATAGGQMRWCCGDDKKVESSQFIHTLVELVKDNQQNNCCIERLLTKVQNRIRSVNDIATAEGGDKKPFRIPSYCSHLQRDFRFKPKA